MGSLWDKLFRRDAPNEIREERLHAVRLVEHKGSVAGAIALMDENARLVRREAAFIRGGGTVAAAFTLVDPATMLCLKADPDGGLDMEGWPSECADIDLGNIMLFKSGLEDIVGRELNIMRVSDYFGSFEEGAEEKIHYCMSVLRELNQLGAQ